MEEYIWVKLVKPWGGFETGETVRFGQPKGGNIIEAGLGVEVPRPKPEKKKPEAETSTLDVDTETAVLAPERTKKKDSKRKAKIE